jgi:hypothetical protein
MFEFFVIMLILPAAIVAGIVILWLTSQRRYFVLVFIAAGIEYVFWLYTFRVTLNTPEHEASILEYARLPTLAFAGVMAVSWYAMSRRRHRDRA